MLVACEADYRGRGGYQDRDYPAAQLWRQALAEVVAVPAGEIAARCDEPAQIAGRVREARIDAIRKLKAQTP